MKKDATTEEKILLAGRKLFSAHGYLGASMSEIAKEVGITKASLYYFFKNKQGLFLAIALDIHDDLEKLLLDATKMKHGKRELKTFVIKMIRVLKPHGALLDTLDPTHFDTKDPVFLKVMEREMEIDVQTQKYLKSCDVKNTKLASHTLYTATQGYLLRIKYGIDDISEEQFANYMATLLTK